MYSTKLSALLSEAQTELGPVGILFFLLCVHLNLCAGLRYRSIATELALGLRLLSRQCLAHGW